MTTAATAAAGAATTAAAGARQRRTSPPARGARGAAATRPAGRHEQTGRREQPGRHGQPVRNGQSARHGQPVRRTTLRVLETDELPGPMSMLIMDWSGTILPVDQRTCMPSLDLAEPLERAGIAKVAIPYGATACLWLAAWIWIGGEFPAQLDIVSSRHCHPGSNRPDLHDSKRVLERKDVITVGSLRVTTPLRTACDIACLDVESDEQRMAISTCAERILQVHRLTPAMCMNALRENDHLCGRAGAMDIFRTMRDARPVARQLAKERSASRCAEPSEPLRIDSARIPRRKAGSPFCSSQSLDTPPAESPTLDYLTPGYPVPDYPTSGYPLADYPVIDGRNPAESLAGCLDVDDLLAYRQLRCSRESQDALSSDALPSDELPQDALPQVDRDFMDAMFARERAVQRTVQV